MNVFNEFHISVERALSEIDPKWRDYNGLIICGSHTPQNTDALIDEIHTARETGKPFLGICFGYQLAAIEYARTVLNIKDATSEEFGEGIFVVKKRPDLKVGLRDGQSWWSNYDVTIDPKFPANFFCVPFHPEYQSRKDKPHPLLVEFLEYAKGH